MAPTQDFPKTVDGYLEQGCAHCKTEDWHAALAAFDCAIARDANHCTAWNYRGNALWGLGQAAAALAAYDRAVALNPDYHQAWFNRGKLLNDLGAYGNALASYQQAIDRYPDPLYLHAQADIWLKRKLHAATT